MEQVTAKSMLGRISRGHLECPICQCRFTEPKILDCLHSFCLACLDDLVSREQRRATRIPCPVCRRITTIPDSGLQGLANCFFLSSLVDEFTKQEQLLGDGSLDPPMCEECDEGLEAVSRCLDCDKNICKRCHKAHERMKSIRNHRIFRRGRDRAEVTPADLRKNETPQCNKHTNQEVCFYCDTCETLACAKCAALDHRTAEHEYRDVADVIQDYRQDVEQVLQEFEKSREQFKVTEESLEHARNRLRIMVTRACKDITGKEEEEIAKIRSKSRLFRNKVAQVGQERDKRFQEILISNRSKMDEAERIVATVSDLMQQADDFQLLDLKPKVMHNLAFQKELEFERAQHGLSYIGVKCHDVVRETDLGEILPVEKWQMKGEFGRDGLEGGDFDFARSVACFSNGDIAMTDTWKKQLMIFTSTGRYKSTVGQKDDGGKLDAPQSVAVTCNDFLLVTDKTSVKVFYSDLKFIRQFSPSHDDPGGESESHLDGIAVDRKNRVAVADIGRKVISIHDLDGSLFTAIPNATCDGDLAISNRERLIFTNCWTKRLMCTNFEGNEVFCVIPAIGETSASPSGVCCDEAGDIYVSVHSGESESCEVHHYDPRGVFIGRVARGMQNPMDLALTPRGDLVISDRFSIKILQRV